MVKYDKKKNKTAGPTTGGAAAGGVSKKQEWKKGGKAAAPANQQQAKGKEAKKKFQPNPLAQKLGHEKGQIKQKAKTSVNGLKKELRDAQRSLSKASQNGGGDEANAPNAATTQVIRDLTRRVKALQLRIQLAMAEGSAKILHDQYKYIKFVEQKKINRRLAQAPPASKLERELQLELLYTQFYPVDLKYIALYPGQKNNGQPLPAEPESEEEPVGTGEGGGEKRKKPTTARKPGRPHDEKTMAKRKEILERLDALREEGVLTGKFSWRFNTLEVDPELQADSEEEKEEVADAADASEEKKDGEDEFFISV